MRKALRAQGSSLNGSALRCMLTAPLRNSTTLYLRRGGRLLLGYPTGPAATLLTLYGLYAFGSTVWLATKHNCFQHGGAGVVSASLARRGGSARSQTAPPYAPPCLCLPLSPCLSLSEFMIMSCGPGGKPQTSKLASSSRNSFTSTMLRHAQTCSDLRHSRVAGGCAGFAYPSRLFLGSSHMPRPYLAPRLPGRRGVDFWISVSPPLRRRPQAA